jgi:hypothetical protein
MLCSAARSPPPLPAAPPARPHPRREKALAKLKTRRAHLVKRFEDMATLVGASEDSKDHLPR